MKKVTLFLCAVLGVAMSMAQTTTFPWNDGFEDATTISNWTIYDYDSYSSNNWSRYSGSSHSGSYCIRSGYNDYSPANDWLVTPALTLPLSAEGFVLKWWVRGSSYAGNSAHYTVRISTAGNDTASFVDTLFAESYPTGSYVERSVSLEEYAGQTVYIAFIHDSYDDNGLYLDDISIYSAMLPVATILGPSSVDEGDAVIFHAAITEGSTDALAYSWSSAMASAGFATLTADADSVTMIYSAGGTDTLRLVVTNSYGSDTTTMFVRICGNVVTFPWEEGFEDIQSLSCWTIGDYDGSTSDNWQRYSSNTYSHSGQYCVRSSYNSSAAANDWLVTPPMFIPSDAEGFILKWHVRGSAYSNYLPHYTVRVSTSGTDTALFADTLFAEEYSGAMVERTATLGSYAGQTIRVAFVHDSYNDNGLYLDDISVYGALSPTIQLVGPTTATEGEPAVYRVALTEGSPTGLSYIWTSTMADAGDATLADDGDSVTIIYYAAGTDTLQVVASNAFGADTASVVVGVCGTVTSLPWSEDFGSADATRCWTILDLDNNSSSNWRRSTSYGGSAYSGYNSSAPANDWLITPPVDIPTSADGMILSWDVRGSSYSGNTAHYTVLLSTSDADTSSFTDTLFAESISSGFVARMAQLSDYAGSTVRFAFIHDSQNDDGLYLDNIAVRVASVPSVTLTAPATVFTGDNVHAVATLSEGSSDGLTFTWSNTLGATLMPSGDSLTLVYSTGGIDTIQVVASNVYGDDTATCVITVIDCSPIDTIPWNEGFEDVSSLQCWVIMDFDGNTNDNWTRNTSSSNIHSGSACMRATYNSQAPANDWLVSPQIQIPADANGLSLIWFVRGVAYQTYQPHYTVLLSTTGSDTASFTDTLFAENYSGDYVVRNVNLDAYAGQDVRVAFVHDSYNDNGIYIDDVAVRAALAPVAILSVPSVVHTGDTVTLTASLVEGSPDSLSYMWSNSAGGSTLTPGGSSATVVYSQGGIDTISVIVYNAYGADTAVGILTVIDCSPITSFPWSESFENGILSIDCWTIIDNDSYAGDNWTIMEGYQYSYDGNSCITSNYNGNGYNDDYIVSPAIAIPDAATDLNLSYYVTGGSYGSQVTTYQVLVSSTGVAATDFTDTLFTESYDGPYALRSIPLGAYAGQTIHFAFHHISNNAERLCIDYISINDEQVLPDSCDAPTIISLSETENAIAFVWSGSAIAYEVAIASGSVDEFSSIAATVLSGSYTFTGLTPGSLYTVGVRGICADGIVSQWVLQEVTTVSTACPAPTNLTATNPTYSEITLAWNTEDEESAFEVNVHSNNPLFDTVFTTTQTSVDVDGLHVGTTYTARVRTRCSATAYSQWCNPVSFTTLSCSTPSELVAGDVGNSTATISWTATSAEYEVSYGIGTYANDGARVISSVNSVVLTNLQPDQTYNVFVRSLCDENTSSAWSARIQFTTTNVGIGEVTGDEVKIYPNPASSIVTIATDNPIKHIELVDINGRQIFSQANIQSSNQAISIDVSSYPAGMYFIRCTTSRSVFIRRMAVQ